MPVALDGPDHQVIWVNRAAIVSVRTVRQAEHVGPGIRCLIHTSDGKFIAVVQGCSEVIGKLKLTR